MSAEPISRVTLENVMHRTFVAIGLAGFLCALAPCPATAEAPQANTNEGAKHDFVKDLPVAFQAEWTDEKDLALSDEATAPAKALPALRRLKALLQAKRAGDCLTIYPHSTHASPIIDLEKAPRSQTVGEYIRTSDFVFLGTVVEIRAGFRGDLPGEILRIAPERIFKDDRAPESSYTYFLPGANLTIGERKVCARAPEYTRPASVGDEILILLPGYGLASWRTDNHFIGHYGAANYLLIDPSGMVELPPALAFFKGFAHLTTRAEVVTALEKAIAEAAP